MATKNTAPEHSSVPIITGNYQIYKMPGKGGWSYVSFDPVDKQYRGHFGVVNVYGTIDNYQLDHYGLMPMKNGRLFLAIRADIRKQIGKQEGDWIEIALYPKSISSACEDDLQLCLEDDPEVYERFKTYTESEKQAFKDWVNAAKGDEQRISRIAEAMDMISQRIKRR